jgi:tRNA threonylcarbamoyl adenosine modification protein YeaZ
MFLLAMDSSSAQVSVALVEIDDDQVETRASYDEVAANAHGELLAPAIRSVLQQADVAVTQLGALGVGLGPGPFTGLRVGIVTAASLADALGVPAYGACSLDAIALNHCDADALLVCSDARRKQVYWARYDSDGRRVAGPDIGFPTDVAAGLAANAVVVGAGAMLHASAFAHHEMRTTSPYPSADNIARLVASDARAAAPGSALTPLYLRRPDAVPPGKPKQVTPA